MSGFPKQERRRGATPVLKGRSGLWAYLMFGTICTIFLNASSHYRGLGSIVTALAASPHGDALWKAWAYWILGPFFLWPLWLPLAMIDFIRWLFRG